VIKSEEVISNASILKLRLYISGKTPNSLLALKNIKKICEEHIQNDYELEIVDLLKDPKLSEEDEILAIPTLVRKNPQPVRKIIGDLSNTEDILQRIGLGSKRRK
jgi:circadian clock protein KaiB